MKTVGGPSVEAETGRELADRIEHSRARDFANPVEDERPAAEGTAGAAVSGMAILAIEARPALDQPPGA